MHSLGEVSDLLLRGSRLERLEDRNLEAEGVLSEALRGRSFQREVILVVGDALVTDFMANLAFNLRQNGFEHWVLVSADRVGCTRLERLRLPCLWSSRLEDLDPSKKRLVAAGIDTPHGANMSLARSFALRERALRLQSGRAWVAREAATLGYNVLVLEPEFSLRTDPYPVLRAATEPRLGREKQASLFLAPDACDFVRGGKCCSPNWAGERSAQVFPCVASSLLYVAAPAAEGTSGQQGAAAVAELLQLWQDNVDRELQNLRRDAGKWNLLADAVERDLTAPLNWAVLNASQGAAQQQPADEPASSKRPVLLKGDATLAVGDPLQWSSLRIPDEWLVRHTDGRAHGRLVGAHLNGDHFLRSKRFTMRAYGWWHYESGRASDSGFHYDSSTHFMGLVPEAEEAMKGLPASAWKLAASRLADIATAAGFTAVLPEVGCADLPGRGWAEREVVVAGYKPLRCYFNTGELWSRARAAPIKCGDRQLLHPAARHDEHFLSLISLRNQTLDIGLLLTRQGGEDVVYVNTLLRAVRRLEAKPGHLILVEPPRPNAALPRVTGLEDMVQHRLQQFRDACPIAPSSQPIAGLV